MIPVIVIANEMLPFRLVVVSEPRNTRFSLFINYKLREIEQIEIPNRATEE